MAGTSLIALIDDIASVLDDVAVLTKVAAKKTAGVLGDDLALNAQQVAGVATDRELPVVWAVAKGSAVNKLILVPVALAISALAPWLVGPLLMFGGAFLCFEGCEKLAHKLFHADEEDAEHEALRQVLSDPQLDLVAFERDKIKGAIRTDFVLSAEIIAIALGAAADATFVTRVGVLTGVAVMMTVGVYGLVALIVKLDDLGLLLSRSDNPATRKLGSGIVGTAPYLMKTLSVAGTAAMFLVGGGILTHRIPSVHHAIEAAAERASKVPGIGSLLAGLTEPLANAMFGILVGAVIVAAHSLYVRARRKPVSP